ncbi:MAG TPA: hypothetical protein VGD23_13120 [Sphingomicrobium sp.]
MMKWMLAAGAAALAIAAPTAAERGGKGGGQERAQRADRGGGQARAQRGGGDRQVRAQRGGGNREFRAARTDRGRERRQSFASFQGNRDDRARGNVERQRGNVERADNRGRGRNEVRMEARGRDRDNIRAVRIDDNRGRGRNDARVFRGDLDGDRIRGRDLRLVDNDGIFRVRDVDRGVVRFRDVDADDLFGRRLGYVNGCPPGLAKKNNGCLPPGQAAKFIGSPLSAAARLAALDPLPPSMRSLYWDDDDYYYRYGGNYLYRVDRDDDLIDSLIPLFGASLIGQPFQPNYYRNSYIPPYYNAFYPNSPYDCHQYGYGYVYETDCMTGLVEDVIPTYDYGYGIGQMLPASYGYYNVPYPYRSYFADEDDYYYRYAPGAIYRVDRDTSLITAVAALLGGGLSVGQPLPIGYSAYNMPLGYRDTYYDTPNDWYRYSDGYIYRVDPTTQLVTALVRAIA